MLTYSLEERGGLPLYEYLYRRIRQDILEGTLAAGERLPSKRALAEHLRISVVTVENRAQGNDIAHDPPVVLRHKVQFGHEGRAVAHDMQQVVLVASG